MRGDRNDVERKGEREEEVKECYERESKKLKDCNAGGREREGEGPVLT